jgi:hypothetical protein
MKFVKGISLFFVYPLICLAIGYLAGLATVEFFYPGSFTDEGVTLPTEYNEQLFVEEEPFSGSEGTSVNGEFDEIALENDNIADGSGQVLQEASGIRDTLNADTEYVILEKDLRRKTLVETIGRLPAEYIGLDRELFLSAMEEYEMFPPLSEMERGFAGLDVISFSPEKVVVQMEYEYLEPSESFYLAVKDNEVIVLLEDKQTVFINTGILLMELPEEIQLKVIDMFWIQDEQVLYNFLESYSS